MDYNEGYNLIKQIGGIEVIWIDKNNNVLTAHTTNPVPFIITNKDISLIPGKLADIAPTILEIMKIEKPIEMTGISLIKK